MEHDDDAVVSLEAWRLVKRPPGPRCDHQRTVLDEGKGTVECRDCGVTLSAFWVLGQIAREENRCFTRIKALRAEAEELKGWVPFLRSMRKLEKRWRGRAMLPACPHCHRGLWPDELERSSVSLSLELAQRKKANIAIPPGASAQEPPG